VVRRLVTRSALAAGVVLTVLTATPSLTAQTIPLGQTKDTDWPTFKSTRSLVTIDCVVTDEDKRQITDLTLDDFEVKYDRRIQKLTNVVYVPMRSGRVPAAPVQSPENSGVPNRRKLAIGPQSGSIRAEQVTRTMAIVVDDLGLSFRSTVDLRNALTRFVDEQVAPGDLIAVLKTSGGIGALQQFTTDKRLLRAAIDKLQWTPVSRRGVTSFEAITPTQPRSDQRFEEPQLRSGKLARLAAGASSTEDSVDEVRMRLLAAGSLGALSFVVRGVKDLPGRKAVIFASEGVDLFNRIGATDVWNAFVRLMDEASRAGVVIYTLGAAGLQPAGLTAEDNPQPAARMFDVGGNDGDDRMREVIFDARSTREGDLRSSQEVLYFLAKQTGGLAFINTNDLAGALGRVVDDLKGYYLLGFDLPDDKPRKWDPGRVSVRVKRPRVTVRWRQGLFGPAGQQDPMRGLAILSSRRRCRRSLRARSLFG
jgi:VWFA-related protein